MATNQNDAREEKPDTHNDVSDTLSVSADASQCATLNEAELIRWQRKIGTRKMLCLRAWVHDGLDDLEIATRLNEDLSAVSAFVVWRNWRGQRDKAASEAARDKVLAKAWTEAVSVKAQSVALDALALAGESAALKDTKGLANAARGAASLVAIARQAEGMDAKGGANESTVNLSLFYFPSPVDKETKNVTPRSPLPLVVTEPELF